MKESEIKDFEKLLENLEKQGWHPMVCDTPVPFYDNDVMCGVPNSVGDVVKEVRMLPKELLAMQPNLVAMEQIISALQKSAIADVAQYTSQLTTCNK